MPRLTRRSLLTASMALAAAPAAAQTGGPPAPTPFRYEDVVRRARELAAAGFEANLAPLPEPLNRLDFDAYRDIRFRPDRALLGSAGGPFRMQLFHLGFLYQRPVTVNVIRDGVPTPVAYQAQLFDTGRSRIDRPLPVNLGFAGFRLHYPLNDPKVFDELIAFLGASYFRFLGRDQRYGLSARGLVVNARDGEPEEFPYFREFWVDVPAAGAERALVYALLDGPSAAGAYRFEIYPAVETTIDVTVTLFPRRAMASVGLAPLTSMFFEGENDRRRVDSFRPELHDSDGLLMHTGAGEWIWRPLHNPARRWVSAFLDSNPRGFGLMQRDRIFENYQDLEAFYHLRPGYWVEPTGSWGEGRVELIELPTDNETARQRRRLLAAARPLRAGPGGRLRLPHPRRLGDGRHAPGRQGREHLPGSGEGERLARPGRCADAPLPDRFRRRQPRLLPVRPEPRAGRAVGLRRPDHPHLRRSERAHEGFPRRFRREARSRPVDRSAGLSARRQQGPDRDLDFPVDGAVTLPVRPARLDDLDGLLAIEGVFPTDRLERRAFRHAVASPTIDLLVAGGAAGPIGYAMVQRRKNAAVGHLTSIAVQPGAAGRGLGKRLLEAAETAARRHGCTRLRLEVRPDNKAAQTLYEKAGYRRIATLADYYEDGTAAWRYEKGLSPEGEGAAP